MGNISDLIDGIIARRKEDSIILLNGKKEIVEAVGQILEDFRKFQASLKSKNCPSELLNLLNKSSELQKLRDLDVTKVQVVNDGREKEIDFDKAAKDYKKEFERLQGRLGRREIQLTLMGKAGQGKSTIIQAITNLGDKVIPSSSGSDCTGAVSVVRSWDGDKDKHTFKMTIDFYSEGEFVEAVKAKLTDMFGEEAPCVSSLRDIQTLEEGRFKNTAKQKIFYRDYVKQYEKYQACIGKQQTTFYKENEVAEYVSKYTIIPEDQPIPACYQQYQRDEDSPQQLLFAKYVTVKKAEIYTYFPDEDTRKLVVVDTVGLGNGATARQDEGQLYDSILPNDTDVAIFNTKTPEGRVSQDPEDETNYVIGHLLPIKTPDISKWISVFVNYKGGQQCFQSDIEAKNHSNGAERLATSLQSKLDAEFCEVGESMLVRAVDAKDKEAVRSFVHDLLERALANLSKIDDAVAKKFSLIGYDLYAVLRTLANMFDAVREEIWELDTNAKTEFDHNYGNLKLRYELEKYASDLKKESSEMSSTIGGDLQKVFDVAVKKCTPRLDDILKHLKGPYSNGRADSTFYYFLDKAHADLLRLLKNANASSIKRLEAVIKENVAGIFKESGRLGRIQLATVADDASAFQWLQRFHKQILEDCPTLYNTFGAFINFEMRAEGHSYSQCVRAIEQELGGAKYQGDNNQGYADKAADIQRDIYNLLKNIEGDLKELFKGDGLSNISSPGLDLDYISTLGWDAVHTLYIECVGGEGEEELRNKIYWEYRNAIWQQETGNAKSNKDLVNTFCALRDKIAGALDESMYTIRNQK